MKLFVKSFLLSGVCLFFLNIGVSAEQNCFDPYERNLIFVDASAKEIVPVDSFQIVFSFDVNTDFFANSAEESKRIIKAIENNINNMKLTNVEIIRGWDFIKQSKISIGAKGRKLSNNLTIRVKDFPKGKLHSLISQIIDLSLGVDKAVILQSLSSFVSEDVLLKKEEEIFTMALSNLKVKAEAEALILGKTSAEPKRVYRFRDSFAQNRQYESQMTSSYSGHKMKKSFISIQKPFNINTEIVDRVEIKASVSGVYEIK